MATLPSTADMSSHTLHVQQTPKYTPKNLYQILPEYCFAVDAITAELERRALKWTNGQTCGQEEIQFVRNIVRLVMIGGHVVWRTSRAGRLQVLEPEAYTLQRTTQGWKINVVIGPNRGWKLFSVFEPPVHLQSPSWWDWPSPVVKSAPHAERLVRVYDNWDRRDLHNSRHAVFCTISNTLRPVGSSGFQWFGGANQLSEDHPLSIRPNQGTFQELLERRTSAIRLLSDATEEERRLIFERSHDGQDLPHDMREREADDQTPVAHEEHIVTDGRDAKESKVLQETPSTRYAIERLRQALLLTLGVPAQAIGESVNTERSSANQNQWGIAVRHFTATAEFYRKLCSEILKLASLLPDGAHIEYAAGTPSFYVETVSTLLLPKHAKRLLSNYYGVPAEHFDERKLEGTPSQKDKIASPTADPKKMEL